MFPGIRANPNKGTPGFDGGLNSAILRYSGAAETDPTTAQPTYLIPMNEVDLHVSEW